MDFTAFVVIGKHNISTIVFKITTVTVNGIKLLQLYNPHEQATRPNTAESHTSPNTVDTNALKANFFSLCFSFIFAIIYALTKEATT